MSMPGLKLERIPALHIPLRFFNAAPWLGVLAALVLLLGVGDQQFATRWNPTLLASVHLLTLGFMTMTMLGALFQVLPVISGETIPGNGWLATPVHLALLLGTIIFTYGWVKRDYGAFHVALPLLSLAVLSFLVALGVILVKRIAGGDSVMALRLAAVSLLLVAVLGVLRGVGYLYPDAFADVYQTYPDLTSLHLAWGFAGWVLLLVMAVSFQVIPMFHVTPNFAPILTKYLPLAVFGSLVLLTLLPGAPVSRALVVVLCGLVACYGGYTLWLLSKRRRKVPDITVKFWRLAIGNLLFAAGLVVLRILDPALEVELLLQLGSSLEALIGVIYLVGFGCSVIIGMLLKIVPFLIYLHLQRYCGTDFELVRRLPNMRQIISHESAQWQFRWHSLVLILLLLSFVLPKLELLAILILALDFAWLGVTINRATRLHWSSLKALKRAVA